MPFMVRHQPPTKFLSPVIKAILSLKCHFYNTLIDCKGRGVFASASDITRGGNHLPSCFESIVEMSFED